MPHGVRRAPRMGRNASDARTFEEEQAFASCRIRLKAPAKRLWTPTHAPEPRFRKETKSIIRAGRPFAEGVHRMLVAAYDPAKAIRGVDP